MRKWLRPDWRARLLDLFACFLIPLYTLLFTHDTRWFTTNFSVIAEAAVAPALPVGRLPAAAVGSGAALYPG